MHPRNQPEPPTARGLSCICTLKTKSSTNIFNLQQPVLLRPEHLQPPRNQPEGPHLTEESVDRMEIDHNILIVSEFLFNF